MSDTSAPPAPSGSLLSTTAGTMTVASLAPAIGWMLQGFPAGQMPPSTPLVVSSVVIILAHALGKVLIAWWNKKVPDLPIPSVNGQ